MALQTFRGRFVRLCAVVLALAAAAPAMAAEMAVGSGGKTYVVAFAQDHMANDWRAAQVRDIQRELGRYRDVRFVFTDAGGRTAQQIADIETLAGQGIDLLITSPRDSVAMAPVIADVHRRGIPVVLLSRQVEGDGYTAFIGASNRDIGRKAAAHLAKRLNGKGRVLILQHIPTTTPGRDRTEAFIEELAKHPGLTVAAIKRADSLRALAIQKVEEALAEKLAFDAIYAQSDSMAAGARIALRAAGIAPGSIPTIGIDYIAEAREAIRAGEQDASFTYPTFGKEGAEVAVRLLRGERVRKEITVDSVAVTRDNVEQVEPIF
ncbi:substrate-binding domain-containing protein [Magnetospirillum sp. UT-4]|uniref:substrate-binding domain-containing protein n=1 Tax=Magnetospirillum sp. UT-4 TaxID=2681467 RepID=UPI0013856B3F|nr:substrate-binding domain-containing protein [Magnetospirillum sp. UT-4]CAA7627041.1 ABC-type sugar transport system, periplasmic component [Magnetospirillum sp. UT-4]